MFETMNTAANIRYDGRKPSNCLMRNARSCIYEPISQNGKVVDSQGFMFDPEDD